MMTKAWQPLTVLGLILAAWPAMAQSPRTAELAQRIDREVQAQLDVKKLQPASRASDAEFLRRVCLDLHGVIPSFEQTTAFLGDNDPQKRSKLIQQLLADKHYGHHMGDVWFHVLVPPRQGKDRAPHHLFKDWLETTFNANKPWDKMTYEILTATAESKETIAANPATTWLMVDSTKTLDVNDATDLVCQVFLGIRMNCAQCHNHPFVDLKRKDYWGMAAFFTQITRRPGFGLRDGPNPKLKLPEYSQVVPARFLRGPEAKVEKDAPLRPVLARWVTAPENPYFARAMVNRTWAHLFGRGIVHPFDDMHEKNPASHPELLKMLTDEFIASGYDVKYLIRAICESETYQRSSWPKDKDASELQWLAHRPVRVLTPAQLYDSLDRLGLAGGKAGKDAAKARKDFVKFFNTDGEANPLAYERGIPQALRLMNATRLEGLQAKTVATGKSPADVIDQMYLTVLSRPPSATERERMVKHVQRAGSDPRPGYTDVLWVLLQSSEFTTNH